MVVLQKHRCSARNLPAPWIGPGGPDDTVGRDREVQGRSACVGRPALPRSVQGCSLKTWLSNQMESGLDAPQTGYPGSFGKS